MQTSDSALLFQTTAQLTAAKKHERKVVASQNVGFPIRVSSKILDLEILGQEAWTAESGWQARCLDLTVSKAVGVWLRGLSRVRLSDCSEDTEDQSRRLRSR